MLKGEAWDSPLRSLSSWTPAPGSSIAASCSSYCCPAVLHEGVLAPHVLKGLRLLLRGCCRGLPVLLLRRPCRGCPAGQVPDVLHFGLLVRGPPAPWHGVSYSGVCVVNGSSAGSKGCGYLPNAVYIIQDVGRRFLSISNSFSVECCASESKRANETLYWAHSILLRRARVRSMMKYEMMRAHARTQVVQCSSLEQISGWRVFTECSRTDQIFQENTVSF